MNLTNLKILRDQVAATDPAMFSMDTYPTCIAGVAVRNSPVCSKDYEIEDTHIFYGKDRVTWQGALSRILECDYQVADMIVYPSADGEFWENWSVQDAVNFLDQLIVEYSATA